MVNKRMKKRRRVPARIKEPLFIPEKQNEVWSMDFMHDSLQNGRKFRVLNIMDDYNREALAIEAHLSIGSRLVVQILEEVIREKGMPKVIRVDNGPEFIATALSDWCKERKITLQFIQPGKPTQNGYIERFNRTYRQNVLDAYLFENLHQVRILSEEWMNEYNHTRPHEALNGKSPVQYRLTTQAAEASFCSLNETTLINYEMN
jgi:putative transposase